MINTKSKADLLKPITNHTGMCPGCGISKSEKSPQPGPKSTPPDHQYILQLSRIYLQNRFNHAFVMN